ncbi:DUF4357 domain-containing protein [Sulfuricurvum sp.]|uniref:DUF4357 domain-containing protein n=1 Tax=Sulfuricurvum sp. TaxID=2025608 RepID=UPI0026065FEE|nr:DUF4357 domain-containing protein [Sulfuricurvum sp.]MDD2265713.1 DUF4357 domain-containing protein [Sulfuricurvum sp.]
MNNLLPNKLRELGEKGDSFVSIFQTTDIDWLSTLYHRLLRNGDLFEFNEQTYNRQPSAAIKKYIEFLQQKNQQKTVFSLNQILYGPPGTGKTYNTINKALAIIDGNVPSERKEAKAKFEEYRKSGQIEFVTFHQSYGYEEFVEGIRAIPVGEEGNEDGEEMIYAVKDGIFKRMSKTSLENYTKSSNPISSKRKFFLHAKTLNIQAEMIEEDANTYRVLKGSKIRKGQAASFENYNYVALKNKLLEHAKLKEEAEFYIMEEDYIFQSMSAASSVILGRQSNGYTDWKEISVENNLFNLDQEKRNYILIIDEINRGNISKIFGELITLIEPSKRIGADEAIKLQLPYSNEEFGVPQNLYIMGTMNTADRSIALMDTALRRRFHFEEMMPDLETLNDKMIEGIDLKKILSTINQRVEYLYDRDHTIGHAYFIDVKSKADLDDVMRNKIFPLLQEYFYDDWEKILMVLGDGFIEKREVKSDIFDYKPDDYLEDEKFIYSIKESFDYTKLQS